MTTVAETPKIETRRADGLKVVVAGYTQFPRTGELVAALRGIGCDVTLLCADFYDLDCAARGSGAEWSRTKLADSRSVCALFDEQMDATVESQVFVLAPPASRSLHMLAGVGCSRGRLVVLLDAGAPELAYRMADDLCVSVEEVVAACLDAASAMEATVECGGLTV